jgi:hypothetical protein
MKAYALENGRLGVKMYLKHVFFVMGGRRLVWIGESREDQRELDQLNRVSFSGC